MAAKTYKHRLVLLDMHAIIHRAYHALPEFSSSAGKPTGALYGMIAMLVSIIEELEPTYIVACYDLPGGTFRNDISDTYKATRKKADDDLIWQIQKSRDVLEACAIPWYEKEGYEADDVLGTIANQVTASSDDVGVVIATGDMDTLQLVDGDRVQVFTLRRGIKDTVLYDETAVQERFSFPSDYLPDYKGLRGDPSDNIMGIKGIGEKTATTLITTYGTIEEIYTALHTNPEAFKEDTGLTDRIITLLENGEEEALFSKTLAQIVTDVPITFQLPTTPWRDAVSIESADAIMTELEFRTLRDRFRTLLGGGHEASVEQQEDEEVAPRTLKETSIALWLINSEITHPSYDDILAYAQTNSFSQARTTIYTQLENEDLMQVYREIEEPIIDTVEHMGEKGIAIDTDHFARLARDYRSELEHIEKKIYAAAGTEFNIRSPQQLSRILFEELELPTKGVKKSSATGAYSTRSEVLEKLQDEHEIVAYIVQYRELQKLLSTYIDVIPAMVGDDGRLHATFLQHGTTTGRFSSSNPNLQNIPIRTELGRAIRGGFIAEEGKTLISFDYSQIELRIAAMLAADEKLISIFSNHGDIHAGVASYMFDVPEAEVTKEMRSQAKVINFGILYGMGVNALQKNLGSSRKEAQEFYNNYFETFPQIAAYVQRSKEFVHTHGYTKTLFGRKRQFPGITSHIPYIRAAHERMAVNAPIQGTQADIIKLAIRMVTDALAEAGLGDDATLLLQIHDELLFEVADEKCDAVSRIAIEEMEHVFEQSFLHVTPPIPICVDAVSGKRWGEMK